MRVEHYEYEARHINAFVNQVTRLAANGYWFYFKGVIPEGKNREAVDAKMLARYDVIKPKWRREKRRRKDSAAVHYLRYGDTFVLMLTKGRHDQFYQDHGFDIVRQKGGKRERRKKSVPDIRRVALSVFGYRIRYTFSKVEKRLRVFVSLNDEERRKLTAHFLTICCWECYRDPERLRREFERLPYAGYSPVCKQLVVLLREVNGARRRRGYEPVTLDLGVFAKRVVPRHGVFVGRAREAA